MTQKETWYIKIEEMEKVGYGECGILRGLSMDDRPDYEETLKWTCENIHQGLEELYYKLDGFPSIQFGVEMAFRSFNAADPFTLFPSDFTLGAKGIPINGLIWMGDPDYMREQIGQQIKKGFNCIKMKIGAIDFQEEIKILKEIRKEYTADLLTLRVDANGGFSFGEAKEKLKRLAELDLHSIEQPIKQGQAEKMAQLCTKTPLPIALDEELIGISTSEGKRALLAQIKPQYIILKPSLIGGFRGSESWIHTAEKLGIGWWITSALESNIGLNAIAQYTITKNTVIPQGLGTGSLFTNNVTSPLKIIQGQLHYNVDENWHFQI